MACYIDDQAKDDLRRSGDDLFDESEGNVTGDTQGQVEHERRNIRRLSSSDSNCFSDSERDESTRSKESYDKENMGGKRLAKHYTSHKSKKRRSKSPGEQSVLSELKKTNELMSSLAKKMKRHESRLKAIENKLSESNVSSSSSSNTTPKRSSATKNVPCEVRVSFCGGFCDMYVGNAFNFLLFSVKLDEYITYFLRMLIMTLKVGRLNQGEL